MKKIIAIILACVMLFAVVGCAPKENATPNVAPVQEEPPEEDSASTPSDEETIDASSLKMVGIIHTTDSFGSMMNQGMQAACDDTGAYMYQGCYNLNYGEQYNLLQTYSTMDIDGICGSIGGDESTAAMIEELASKMPVTCINSVLDNQGSVVGMFSSNNYDLATMAAEYMVDWWQENRKDEKMILATIGVMEGSTAIEQRHTGFTDAMENAGIPYEEVARGYGYAADTVMQQIGDMLTANPDINMIWTDNEMAAVGAVNAVIAANKQGQVKVATIDISAQICDLLLDESGVLVCASGQDGYSMAYDGMMTAIKACLGLQEPYTEIQYVDPILFTRDNPDGVKEYQDWLNTLAG